MSRNRKNRSNRSHGVREQVTQAQYALAPPAPFLPPASVPPFAHVNVQVLHDRNASVANVQVVKRTTRHYEPPEYEYQGSGSAKREKGDVHDETTGELLALARAFEALSRQLRHDAA